jgi:hypothetical protein
MRAVLFLGALLLAACAAPYRPQAGDDAAKLRVRMANGAGITTLWTHVRPLNDGRCGGVMRLGMLTPYTPPGSAPARGPNVADAPAQAPRAGMVGSPDAQRTDVGEYALAPGRYQVGLIGTTFGQQCASSALMALEAGRQYELELLFDSAQRRCLIRAARLERRDGREAFERQPLTSGDAACG